MMGTRKFFLVASCLLSVLLVWADGHDDSLLVNLVYKRYNGTRLTESQMDSLFDDFQWDALSAKRNDDDEEDTRPRYTLRYTDKEKLFRHSFMAHYLVYDRHRKEEFPLSQDKIRDVTLSPNNKYITYAKSDGNLYIYKLDYRTEVAITKDTFPYINGISDWLYEEEFGATKLYSFSPDAKYIAFVKLNLQDVEQYKWMTYSDTALYPEMHSLAYPKVSTSNPIAQVFVYDIYFKTIRIVKVDNKEDDYIPLLTWRRRTTTQNVKEVFYDLVVEKINRDQNKMTIYSVNPKSQVSTTLYKESSEDFYIDYALFKQTEFLSDGRWVTVSEKEGWRSLYLGSENGLKVERLTPNRVEVCKLNAVDETTGNLYYQVATTPLERVIYCFNLKTRKPPVVVGPSSGWNDIYFSKDRQYYIFSHESNTESPRYDLYQTKNHVLVKPILDNRVYEQRWNNDNLPDKEFFSFVTPRGDTLYGWMIRPLQERKVPKEGRFPCVIMQYSGPGSQRVTDRWSKAFGHYLAYKGYVVICVDGRGTGARGRQWRNASYLHIGEVETEDQLYTALYARKLSFVDANRIAICGWSYGGYVALRSLMEQQSFAKNNHLSSLPFRCGIAIAPVTDWRYYDSGYTERFMREWSHNDVGYEQASLLSKAKDLSGNLLLVHALADDNVHFQHSAMLIEALNKAGKMYDLQIYPNDNHSIRKDTHRIHLHKRILKYLNDNL